MEIIWKAFDAFLHFLFYKSYIYHSIFHMPMHHTLVYIIIGYYFHSVRTAHLKFKTSSSLGNWRKAIQPYCFMVVWMIFKTLNIKQIDANSSACSPLFPRLFSNDFSICVTTNYKSTNGNALTEIELLLSIAHLHEYSKFENKQRSICSDVAQY